MPTRTFGPSKGNRRPTTAIPGSSGAGRPAAQKGGGGNKAAGSVEPTAANTPTVTVHSDGSVTASNIASPKAAARETQRARQSQRRTSRIRSEVLKTTRPQPVRAKGPSIPGPRQPAVPTRQEKGAAVRKAFAVAKPTTQAEYLAVEQKVAKRLGYKLGEDLGTKKATPVQQHPRAVKKVKRQLKTLRAKAHGGSGQLHSTVVTTPAQSKIAKTVLRVGQKEGATRKEKLAALDTGLQETGFKNLKPYENGFNENTAGWREELAPYYTGRLNVKKSAREFFKETKTDPSVPGGGGETPGELSQTVQGSNYGGEETYGTHDAEARSLLHQFNHGKANPKVVARLKKVEGKAERLGVSTKEKAPPKVVKKYKAAISAMNQIAKKGYDYQWGGGHGAKAGEPVGGPGPGFDCSGAISAMLHAVGVLDSPLTSGDMGQVLAPGRGAITVFYNGVHTFAYIPAKHEYWGTSESTPQGGGAGWFPKSVGDAEAAAGDSGGVFHVGHVPGLGKKQARQLGILDLGSGGSTSTGESSPPGMTISPGGTTATVTAGSGVHQKEVGFSKHPLTLSQRVGRTTAKLKALGVIKEPTTTSSEPRLTALEKKYGRPAV